MSRNPIASQTNGGDQSAAAQSPFDLSNQENSAGWSSPLLQISFAGGGDSPMAPFWRKGSAPVASVGASGAAAPPPATASSGGASGSSGGDGSGSGSGTVTVSQSGSGLVFINTYASGDTAAFEACIVAAEKQLEGIFTNSLTVRLTFNMAATTPTKSNPNPFALSNDASSYPNYNYSTLKAALLKVAPGDVLPASDPSGGAGFNLPVAYARFLGLTTSAPSTDATVTLNTYYSWDFGQDVINGLTHEISEGGLGRVSGLGDQNSEWSTMDLFRYTSAGVYDTTDGRDGQTTYFSSNGGATTSAPAGLSFYNEYSGSKYLSNGDPDDWNQQAVFGSTGQGETFTLVQTELNVMNTLGWTTNLSQQFFTATSGDWETPTNWFYGYSPITVEDAAIGVLDPAAATLGANVTVNSIATNSLSSLTIDNNATVIFTNGTVLNPADALYSTLYSGNLGTLSVDVGSTLEIGNTFYNSGTLTIGAILNGSGGNGSLQLNGADLLINEVTLDGSGTLNLGQYGFQTFSTGSISDGLLVNVNDTIIGGGSINVSSFDNQSNGKVEANQSEGNALQISASTFTNEGDMFAENRATLDFGQDGGTGSLADSGAIELEGEGALAISGNFTVNGSGAIAFKGAGAEIISDGTAAATFINNSSIDAFYSGQIGDVGVYGVTNDLTFDNYGTTLVSGSGQTLTLNTGGNTIGDGGGTLEAEGDGHLVIDSTVDTGVFRSIIVLGPYGSGGTSSAATGGTIEAETGGVVTVAGVVQDGVILFSYSGQVVINGGTFEMLAGASVSVPIEFTGTGGTFLLHSMTASFDTIYNFAVGDTIDQAGLSFSSVYEVLWNTATNTVEIIDTADGNAVVESFTLAGTPPSFVLATLQADAGGDTDLFLAPESFAIAPDAIVVSSISGQAYTAYEQLYTDGLFAGTDFFYTNVPAGAAYSAYQTNFSAGGDLIGSQFYYTNVTGQIYTAYEDDFNGGGQLTRAAYTGVSGQPFSAYEYDYVGGLLSGLEFTYANVPAGATYSSYVVDYNYASAYAGAQFFYTNISGQSYTGEEVDLDAANQLSRVLQTGISGQPYSSVELDYSAGAFDGAKYFYTGVTGQPYSAEEVDVTPSDQLEKLVYSGMTTQPYSSVEFDYSGGAVSAMIFNFTDVTGQAYYADQVEQNAIGGNLQQTLDMNAGGHDIFDLAGGQTLTSLGDDLMVGGATGGTTFHFNAIYGAGTIANLLPTDIISLPKSEFTLFSQVHTAAANVGANVVITAGDGDTLTIANMSVATLAATYSGNFTFHS